MTRRPILTGASVALVLLALTLPAWALTEAQLPTLKTAILADPWLATMVQEYQYPEIAAYYNALGSTPPTNAAFWVWRTSVPASDYTGANGIVWTEVDTLTVGKARIFEWMTGGLLLPIDASDPNKRQGIADAFGVGTTTRANLLALGKREATRGEQVFATGPGTGTNGSPATLTFEGLITTQDVATALALP